MIIKRIYLKIAILLLAASAWSQSDPYDLIEQPVDNSPYSRFGLGDVNDLYFSHLYHMGALGAAYQDENHLNIANPASYPYLKSAAFEIGLYAERSQMTESNNSFTSWNGNLNYIALGFPLANPINDLLDRVERTVDVGMTLSLVPFTRVAYNIRTTEEIDGIETVSRNYIGNGGTYTFQWGTGVRYKDFSAGVNLGYLFGNIGTDRIVTFEDLNLAFDNVERIDSRISGLTYNLGVQYKLVLNKAEIEEKAATPAKTITFGLYGNPSTKFKSQNDELFLAVKDAFTFPIVDTISNVLEEERAGRLPGKIGFGVMYNQGSKWGGGFNIESQSWSKFENEVNPIQLSDAFKVSVGGYFRPDPNSFTNYLKRIYYQAGFFYNKESVTVENEDVTSTGVTLGVGLPFINQRKVSSANIGVTLGNRGINTTIEERYLRLNFGFTFNSTEWFIKRKYN